MFSTFIASSGDIIFSCLSWSFSLEISSVLRILVAFCFFFSVAPMFVDLSLEASFSVCKDSNLFFLFCFLLFVTVVQPSLSSSWALIVSCSWLSRSYASPITTLERSSSSGRCLCKKSASFPFASRQSLSSSGEAKQNDDLTTSSLSPMSWKEDTCETAAGDSSVVLWLHDRSSLSSQSHNMNVSPADLYLYFALEGKMALYSWSTWFGFNTSSNSSNSSSSSPAFAKCSSQSFRSLSFCLIIFLTTLKSPLPLHSWVKCFRLQASRIWLLLLCPTRIICFCGRNANTFSRNWSSAWFVKQTINMGDKRSGSQVRRFSSKHLTILAPT